MNRWTRRGAAALLVAGGAIAWLVLSPTGEITVIDGDTIERNKVRHRLVGYDAPEIRRTACKTEKARGLAARSRLEQLLATASHVRITPTGKPDRYGRMLSRMSIDGEDVATIAVREGWGIRYDGRRDPKPDWCLVQPTPAPPPDRRDPLGTPTLLPARPADARWVGER